MSSRAFAAAVVVASLALLACHRKPAPVANPYRLLTEPEKQVARDKLKAARDKAAEYDRAHRALITDVEHRVVALPALGACPVTARTLVPDVPEPTTENGKRAVAANRASRILRMTDVYAPETVHPAGIAKDGPAGRAAESGLEDAERGLANVWQKPEDLYARIDAAAAALDAGYDLSLVTRVFERPELVSQQQFDGGRIEGTLFLFSRRDRKLICATPVSDGSSARVTARGTDPLDLRENADLAVYGDLLVGTISRALPNLTAAGPPDPADAGAAPDAGKPKGRKKHQ